MKKGKNYIAYKNFKLNSEDIRKAVNAFDKNFGINLKNPEIFAEPKTYFNIILENAKLNLSALLVLVNGAVFTDYFNINYFDGTLPKKPIGLKHPSFLNDSILRWDNERSVYETDTLIFRTRFISLVLEYIRKDFDLIIKRAAKQKKFSFYENGIVLIKKFMDDIIRFIFVMVNTDVERYKNTILNMHSICSYKTYKKEEQEEWMNTLNGKVNFIRNSMNSSLFEDKFFNDDNAIYEIMTLAYILATEEYTDEEFIKFKYVKNATKEHDLILLIEALGKSILKHNKKSKYPIMFRSFVLARPNVHTEHYIESRENKAIQMGLLALYYTKFVINYDITNNFIDEMLRKGI